MLAGGRCADIKGWPMRWTIRWMEWSQRPSASTTTTSTKRLIHYKRLYVYIFKCMQISGGPSITRILSSGNPNGRRAIREDRVHLPREIFYLFKWKFPKYLNQLLNVVVWGSVTICPVTTRDMTIFRQALTQLIKLHLFAARTESDYRWWASTHSCEDNWINVNIEKLKSWLRAFCTIWQLLGRLARFDIRREMISA